MNHPRSDLEALKADLHSVYDGQPWHGSSITEVLNGVSADTAALKPIPTGHSIWELVLHMTVWTREVMSRLSGNAPKSPPEDWPAPPRGGREREWDAAKRDLERAQLEVEQTVRSLEEKDLLRWIVDKRDESTATGMTAGSLVRGLLQHHTYHQGQIALLKRAAETTTQY